MAPFFQAYRISRYAIIISFVWPWAKGNVRGHSIIPLYSSVPEAARQDDKLYELLALVDALRIGRAREKNLAINELKKRILHE
jgi:hypothetical protein